jgi:hypothetical protein
MLGRPDLFEAKIKSSTAIPPVDLVLATVTYDRLQVPRTRRYKGKLTKRFLRFLAREEKMEKLLIESGI